MKNTTVQRAMPATLAEMIAAVGFATGRRFCANISERNFPLEKESFFDARGLRLFGGDCEYSINEVEAAIKPAGGRLEGLVRGLAYLKANPGALKGGPIVFPASSWVGPVHDVCVPCADLDGAGPWVGLHFGPPGIRWPRRCRFLVSGESGRT